MLLLLIIALVCAPLEASRVLVILDNRNTLETHSKLFASLQAHHSVTFAMSFGSTPIELRKYDENIYQHVVVMCTSEKQIQSKIKPRDLINYFDFGANLIIVGDLDTSFSFRKLFYGFGVEIEESGSILRDHFSKHIQANTIVTSNYEQVEPFFRSSTKLPLAYRGIGMSLVNYENHQLYSLIRTESTTFSKNLRNQNINKAGSSITLAAGIQGINNARALVLGSMFFLSDEAFNLKQFGNKQATRDLIAWVMQEEGVLRVKTTNYHKQESKEKESLFSVGDAVSFSTEIEIQKNNVWTPYVADDLQVEMVMLDPWVRTALTHTANGRYVAHFFAPQKEGIYQFKIIYTKPGYTFLKTAERVTVRPYRHDQYERFLFVASPYTFGTLSTILSTFLFVVLYVYLNAKDKLKKE